MSPNLLEEEDFAADVRLVLFAGLAVDDGGGEGEGEKSLADELAVRRLVETAMMVVRRRTACSRAGMAVTDGVPLMKLL